MPNKYVEDFRYVAAIERNNDTNVMGVENLKFSTS